jgi:hypothetical protein
MMRSVKDCAPTKPTALWRARVLAFLFAALVGFVVPSGCAIGPEGRPYPSRESVEGFFFGSGCDCGCNVSEASCGAPSESCQTNTCPPESIAAECPPADCPKPRRKFWHHLPKCHLYEPEAGIFNFCIPPQCINPPPPLPPGRFFPVPVRPAFAQRDDVGYGLLMGGNTGAPAADYGYGTGGYYGTCP